MKIKTKLGEIEVDRDKLITFEEGMPGLEHLRKFVIVSNGSDPIMWLVSVEDESVALPVINPWIIRIDYTVDIPKDAMEDLGIESKEDVQVWAILVIPHENPENMTINLMAPIIINTKNNKAKQIIMENSGYGIRHLVKEELERSKKISEKVSADVG